MKDRPGRNARTIVCNGADTGRDTLSPLLGGEDSLPGRIAVRVGAAG
jgi:hypothetical protein